MRAISERYIVGEKQSGPLKLYDIKSGKFVAQIGNKGRGNGEYTYVISCKIDEKKEVILLYCTQGSKMGISIYGFDGKFQKYLPLAEGNFEKINTYSFDLDDNFTIISSKVEDENTKFRIVRQNYEGEEIQKADFDTDKWIKTVTNVSSGDVYMTFQTNNNDGEKIALYRYDFKDNSAKACFSIDCNYKTRNDNGGPITFDYIETPNRYFAVRYDTEIFKNDEGLPVGLVLTTKDILMTNKKDLTGGSVRFENDIFGYPLNFANFSFYCKKTSGYYLYNSEAIELFEKLEKVKAERGESLSAELSSRIDELMDYIDIEGNPIVIYGKLK